MKLRLFHRHHNRQKRGFFLDSQSPIQFLQRLYPYLSSGTDCANVLILDGKNLWLLQTFQCRVAPKVWQQILQHLRLAPNRQLFENRVLVLKSNAYNLILNGY